MTNTAIPADQDFHPYGSIKSIHVRRVLNSHAEWTNEFVVELLKGARGTGSSPRGETLSVHESPFSNVSNPEQAVKRFVDDNALMGEVDQTEFDRVLKSHHEALGHGNVYALSQAFFYATAATLGLHGHELLACFRDKRASPPKRFPHLLFNILNGGLHAYTNPVLSDFSEFLLVPHDGTLESHLAGFHAISCRVREELAYLPTCRVGNNLVHHQTTNSNQAWVEFLLAILEKEGLSREFGIMIDASAGDLMVDGQYRFSSTSGDVFNPEAFTEYWVDMLSAYPINILEDPFSEVDTVAWQALTDAFPQRLVAGDNLCATNSTRIANAIDHNLMSAVLIKPDQAGTVSSTIDALNTAGSRGLAMIPSHRSIETDSLFLSDICSVYEIECTKLGLLSDFATIVKLNQLIRDFDSVND